MASIMYCLPHALTEVGAGDAIAGVVESSASEDAMTMAMANMELHATQIQAQDRSNLRSKEMVGVRHVLPHMKGISSRHHHIHVSRGQEEDQRRGVGVRRRRRTQNSGQRPYYVGTK